MIIEHKTYNDLSEEEKNIFTNIYPHKTTKELMNLTQLDENELNTLKKVVEQEKGITLTKNKNFVLPSENPLVPTTGITSLSVMLNSMPENQRQEAFELARNLPNALTLVNELIPVQIKRVEMGITAEVLAGRGNNMHTENAVNNYLQMIKIKEEIENGSNINVEHSFASVIEKAVEREKAKEIETEIVTDKQNPVSNQPTNHS